MTTNEKLEIWEKQLSLLNEFGKLLGALLLVFFVLASLVFPVQVRDHLIKMGVKDLDIAGFKFVIATEAVKANDKAVDLANTLTAAEISLSKNAAPDGSVSRTEVSAVLKTIEAAKVSLEQQSKSIARAATEAGIIQVIPKTGWLRVGYYDDKNNLSRPSDYIEKNAQVQQIGDQLKEVVLAFDAPLVADGDHCDTRDVSEMKAPDPSIPEFQYAILRASSSPLKVLAQARCPSVGKGSQLYVQVSVPSDRVRIAKLSELAKK